MPQIKRTRERKDLFFLFRRCKGDRSFLRAKNLAPSFALRRAKPDSSYSAVKRSLFCARKILPRLLHCDEQSLILPRFSLLFPLVPPINRQSLPFALEGEGLPVFLHCDRYGRGFLFLYSFVFLLFAETFSNKYKRVYIGLLYRFVSTVSYTVSRRNCPLHKSAPLASPNLTRFPTASR